MTTLPARLRRLNPFDARTDTVDAAVQLIARFGYGARGFVYLSVGIVVVLAALGMAEGAIGTSGAVGVVSLQPFGQVWLFLLGVGLWAFFLWRVLQSVFDADHGGRSPKALVQRAGQGISGLVHALLALTVFEVLDEADPRPDALDVQENQQMAASVLSLPFGDWLLIGAGLTIASVGLGNVVRGLRTDFGEDLVCPDRHKVWFCRIARAGYVARGAAYLPLAGFVLLAGWRARAEPVTDFGGALDALSTQPGGTAILALTGVGLAAFGVFAFIEAGYRRIRPPRDLNPLD